MRVAAARTLSAMTQRVLFLSGLFVFVVALQIGLVTGLREAGLGGGLALTLSGVAVLAVVIGAVNALNWAIAREEAKAQAAREALGLPDGPCCVLWRAEGEAGLADGAFPWEFEGVVRARYPKIARRFGVEGYALVHFEVSADGSAKNLHCLEAFPAPIFYDAAVEALRSARFRPRPGLTPRFGGGYRMPFVFRIAGYARTGETARRAKPARFWSGPARRAA